MVKFLGWDLGTEEENAKLVGDGSVQDLPADTLLNHAQDNFTRANKDLKLLMQRLNGNSSAAAASAAAASGAGVDDFTEEAAPTSAAAVPPLPELKKESAWAEFRKIKSLATDALNKLKILKDRRTDLGESFKEVHTLKGNVDGLLEHEIPEAEVQITAKFGKDKDLEKGKSEPEVGRRATLPSDRFGKVFNPADPTASWILKAGGLLSRSAPLVTLRYTQEGTGAGQAVYDITRATIQDLSAYTASLFVSSILAGLYTQYLINEIEPIGDDRVVPAYLSNLNVANHEFIGIGLVASMVALASTIVLMGFLQAGILTKNSITDKISLREKGKAFNAANDWKGLVTHTLLRGLDVGLAFVVSNYQVLSNKEDTLDAKWFTLFNYLAPFAISVAINLAYMLVVMAVQLLEGLGSYLGCVNSRSDVAPMPGRRGSGVSMGAPLPASDPGTLTSFGDVEQGTYICCFPSGPAPRAGTVPE